MRDGPELLLIFPPFWDTASPYLSVPTLAAWLRKEGVEVEAIDLNRHCASRLLTAPAMEDSLCAAHRVLSAWSTGSNDDRVEFANNLALCERVWQRSGNALLAPFHPGAPPPRTVDDYTALRRKLGWAFSIVSAPFYPARLKVEGLVGTDALSRMSSVCDLAESRSGAPGLEGIEAFARAQARRGIPIVGISVAGPSQLMPALLLARVFKQCAPETHVCVGGPQIPYLTDALRHYVRPFDWVDTFVPGEGELPLTELCRAIHEGRDAARVPGLLVRRDGVVVSTGSPDRVDIAALPPPDFTGFEPWRYFGNGGCLPLAFARGCSWSRCAFCTQHICFDGYRAMLPKQVEEHITTVVERHGVRTLAINDENLTPQRLRQLARIVRTRCPGVRWQALARLAQPLSDTKLARELSEAGCVMLSMGLESSNQSVLDLNGKGIRASKVPDILRALHDAGIWLNVFLIFGLPGETPETAFRTVAFVSDHHLVVDSISPTVFRVEKGSPIASHPANYGIVMDEVPSDHCESELPIARTEWLNKSEAMVCLEMVINSLVGRPQCPIEQADLNGQFVLQMLADMGVGGLRAEMQRRAVATGAASVLLEQDESAFRMWWANVDLPAPAETENRVILALPDRGTFFTLTPNELQLLRLRSLGLPVDEIWRSFGSLLTDEVARAGMAWEITASMLLLLSSRMLQESANLGLPLQTLQLHGTIEMDKGIGTCS